MSKLRTQTFVRKMVPYENWTVFYAITHANSTVSKRMFEVKPHLCKSYCSHETHPEDFISCGGTATQTGYRSSNRKKTKGKTKKKCKRAKTPPFFHPFISMIFCHTTRQARDEEKQDDKNVQGPRCGLGWWWWQQYWGRWGQLWDWW